MKMCERQSFPHANVEIEMHGNIIDMYMAVCECTCNLHQCVQARVYDTYLSICNSYP